jgi:hypothetical protein
MCTDLNGENRGGIRNVILLNADPGMATCNDTSLHVHNHSRAAIANNYKLRNYKEQLS